MPKYDLNDKIQIQVSTKSKKKFRYELHIFRQARGKTTNNGDGVLYLIRTSDCSTTEPVENFQVFFLYIPKKKNNMVYTTLK